MGLRGFLKELHHRNVWKVAVAYVAAAAVLLEVLTHLFHNFEAPDWVLKVITTLLIAGLPVACLMAWGFEFREGGVRSIPRVPKETKPALPAPEATAPPSIAVLPFADMSAEHDQQYLGDGIAEELLNALASIEGLNVAARTSSFSFAGKGASMTEIGDTLHVRHVLEGSVRRAGQKLRVTAQLIDVKSGFHLFTQSYDREVKDIFEIQNDIAREIAGALLPKLGMSQDVMLVRQGTSNLEAYNLRLKAHRWMTEPSPGTIRTAIEQLRQAIQRDPHYADAWGDLAYIYAFSTSWVADPVPLLIEAYHAAQVALVAAPTNVPALLVQAYVSILVHHDSATAQKYSAQAREAGVDLSVWAFNNALLHDGPLGRYDEAIAALKEAERKDPLAPTVKWALATMYLASGRNKEAVAVAKELLGLNVTAPDGIGVIGVAIADPVEARRARDALEALASAAPEDFSHVANIHQFGIDGAIGDRAHARELLDRLLRKASAGELVSPDVIAEGYKALGDYDHAIEWWRRAVDQRAPYTLAYMAVTSRTHPVIGKDPRFLALLKRMGLEAKDERS